MVLRRYKEQINCVSLGEPPKANRRNIETIKFTVYDLETHQYTSEDYLLHGCYWNFTVFLDEHVDFVIRCKDKSFAELDAKVLCRCTALDKKQRGKPDDLDMDMDLLETKSFLEAEACRRLIKSDGCAVFEIDISLAGGKNVWYPKKLVRNDTLVQMYDNADSQTGDVVFSVGEYNIMYKAHKSILAVQGKKLYELANENDDDTTPIPILCTKPEIFKSLLDFVYSVKTPDITNEETAKALLVAADRFECVHLKLYAESVLVDKFLSVETTSELFSIAVSYSCAYLQEAASNMFLKNAKDVRESKGWSEMKESKELLLEMLGSISSSKNEFELYEDFNNNIEEFTVTLLREELAYAGLELDGTRETLVKRLNSHINRRLAKKQKTS